jgi:deoxyribodipyrimidine photolyase
MEQQEEPRVEQTVLMLFRKDLRLDDNPALLAALQAAKNVVSAAATAVTDPGFMHSTHSSTAVLLVLLVLLLLVHDASPLSWAKPHV